jgi:hypothetical protein
MNEYIAAEGYAIGEAAQLILGMKLLNDYDTIIGDPDVLHQPLAFAEFDE